MDVSLITSLCLEGSDAAALELTDRFVDTLAAYEGDPTYSLYTLLSVGVVYAKALIECGQREAALDVLQTLGSCMLSHTRTHTYTPESAFRLDESRLVRASPGLAVTHAKTSAYATLATLFHTCGDLPSAERMYTAYAKVIQAQFGDESLETSNALFFIGVWYLDTAFNPQKAAAAFEAARAIRTNLLGAIHPTVVDCYINLGLTYVALGELDQAVGALNSGLRLAQKLEDEECIASCLEILGKVNVARDDHRIAYECFVEAANYASSPTQITSLAKQIDMLDDVEPPPPAPIDPTPEPIVDLSSQILSALTESETESEDDEVEEEDLLEKAHKMRQLTGRSSIRASVLQNRSANLLEVATGLAQESAVREQLPTVVESESEEETNRDPGINSGSVAQKAPEPQMQYGLADTEPVEVSLDVSSMDIFMPMPAYLEPVSALDYPSAGEANIGEPIEIVVGSIEAECSVAKEIPEPQEEYRMADSSSLSLQVKVDDYPEGTCEQKYLPLPVPTETISSPPIPKETEETVQSKGDR